MSSAGINFKKQKTFHNNKPKNLYNQRTKKNYLEVGQRGFLATCNFREKDCVRECYNILNEYADEIYGPNTGISKPLSTTDETSTDPTEEIDISDELDQVINETKKQASQQYRRFQVMDTGANNCIFIKTTLENPVELGIKIVEDIAENKLQKTRHLLRLVPIEIVCKANIKDIIDAVGPYLDKHFLNSEKTYSVVFNRRYNNNINRSEIINGLAEMVAAKGVKNKVDLKTSELSIIVEVIKGLCCLSIVPNYNQWKRYNLVELATVNQDYDKNDEAKIENKKNEEENVDVKNDEAKIDNKKNDDEKNDEGQQ